MGIRPAAARGVALGRDALGGVGPDRRASPTACPRRGGMPSASLVRASASRRSSSFHQAGLESARPSFQATV
ncbi:hypothetical protein AB5I41_07840 [Sphingomonas sp. MMS24-JH45]